MPDHLPQRDPGQDRLHDQWDPTVKIAKTRTGSFFPSLLTPRRRIDVALHAVVMEAYVHGVSTRKVDDLVTALGAEPGISPPRLQGALRERDVLGAIQLGPPAPRPNHAATK